MAGLDGVGWVGKGGGEDDERETNGWVGFFRRASCGREGEARED